MMIKPIIFTALFMLIGIPCFARDITFPYTIDFSGDYSDVVRSSGGCGHATDSSGGWNGNDAAKFTPPTTGDSYCGIGVFSFSGTSQINVRFLYYASADFAETETRNNKLVSVNPPENNRPMIYMTDGPNPYQTLSPGWNASLYVDYDDPDLFKIGDGNYEDQWISVELEAIVATAEINVYVTTQDGVYTGLLGQHIRETAFTNLTYIDFIGGYFNAGSFSASETTYYKISHVEVDDSYIGPPAGFVGSINAMTIQGNWQ